MSSTVTLLQSEEKTENLEKVKTAILKSVSKYWNWNKAWKHSGASRTDKRLVEVNHNLYT